MHTITVKSSKKRHTHLAHTMVSVMGALSKLAQQSKTRLRGAHPQHAKKHKRQSSHRTHLLRHLVGQAVPRVPCQNFEEDVGL